MILIVIGLTMGLLLLANVVQKKIGDYGISVISKVMGLILAAYAVQSVLSGVKDFFFD